MIKTVIVHADLPKIAAPCARCMAMTGRIEQVTIEHSSSPPLYGGAGGYTRVAINGSASFTAEVRTRCVSCGSPSHFTCDEHSLASPQHLQAYMCGIAQVVSPHTVPAAQSAPFTGYARQQAPECPLKGLGPAPEVPTAVVGFRAWAFQDWQLKSTGVGNFWEPGIQRASCHQRLWSGGMGAGTAPHDPERAPDPACDCGIYGLARYAKADSHWPNNKLRVLGAIEAWSEGEGYESIPMCVHPTGFRAPYARVVALAYEEDWPRARRAAIRALAQDYEAQFVPMEHLEDAAREHGQFLPEEVLRYVRKAQASTAVGTTAAVLTKQMAEHHAKMAKAANFATTAEAIRKLAALFDVTAAPKTKKKGIKMKGRIPGPPNKASGKWSQGDRYQDSRGKLYLCVRGGTPGVWEEEE